MIHRSTSVELFPLTVFVGANNSGKSSLFESLLNLRNLSIDPLNQNDVMGTGPYSFRGRSSNAADEASPIGYALTITPGSVSPASFDYRVAFRQTAWNGRRASYEITDELLRDGTKDFVLVDRSTTPATWPEVLPGPQDDQTVLSSIRQAARGLPEDFSELVSLATTFSRIGKFRLEASVMRNPGSPSDRLGYQGQDLAGLLYNLWRKQLEEYDNILDHLREAIDGFRRFLFNDALPPNDKSGLPTIGLKVEFDDSRGAVDAPNLSDGTLLVIGWITLLNLPEHHRVLMLEEPEVGLTPAATRSVFDAVIRVSQRKDGAQVLVSTHSPYFLAWSMEQEDGKKHSYVLRQEDGETRAEAVKDIQDARSRELGGGTSFDIRRASLVDEANQILQSL
jgi:hypothetical protein